MEKKGETVISEGSFEAQMEKLRAQVEEQRKEVEAQELKTHMMNEELKKDASD